jgi:hypothetical protein
MWTIQGGIPLLRDDVAGLVTSLRAPETISKNMPVVTNRDRNFFIEPTDRDENFLLSRNHSERPDAPGGIEEH